MEWKWLGKLGSAAVLGLVCLLVSLAVVSSERSIGIEGLRGTKHTVQEEDIESNYIANSRLFLWQTDKNSYKPVWPPMEFGWKIAVGSMIAFFGAAFGSVGGVGGGGIFVPMLTLIVGFDPKSTTAISKCMIMGAAGSTVYYNLRLRHPSLHMPVIDYDLALLIQPMLMLGISIDIIFNVVFPDWMVTVLLIVLFMNNLGTSTKAFMKGVDTWKLETILKREAAKRLEDIEYEPLPMTPTNTEQKGAAVTTELEVPRLQNIYWKELGLLVFVWMSFLALQIAKVRDLRHELYSYMFHMVLDIKLLTGMMNLFASRCDGGGSSMLVVVHVFTNLGDHSCNHLEIQ
ncbi:sulfite exporter TauE/SafE family protein 3-like [Zingiber officinale]|uniref:sulfite exporter TauE/SafE family protein 3-like n=1 Tax=Zingiber officinale TaxID=94328 RepID=UPI001C4B7CA9|nr:sulfite exporter TauE/SafE family protein 3-like [Zingiber officinale]